MTRTTAALLLFALAIAVPALAVAGVAAQEFAADLVNRDAAGAAPRPAGKLNVSAGRIRLETPDAKGGYVLVLTDARAAYFVQPASRVALVVEHASLPARMLVAVDPDNPCLAWQALPKTAATGDHDTAEWRCERSGSDDADGHGATVAYLATSPEGQRYLTAIDRKLRFPVSLASADGTVLEVVNVSPGPQPQDLFVLPANYQKFSLQELIERMKHADVSGASTPPQ